MSSNLISSAVFCSICGQREHAHSASFKQNLALDSYFGVTFMTSLVVSQ